MELISIFLLSLKDKELFLVAKDSISQEIMEFTSIFLLLLHYKEFLL